MSLIFMSRILGNLPLKIILFNYYEIHLKGNIEVKCSVNVGVGGRYIGPFFGEDVLEVREEPRL